MARIKNTFQLTTLLAALLGTSALTSADEIKSKTKDPEPAAKAEASDDAASKPKTDNQADANTAELSETRLANERKKHRAEMERKRKERYIAMFHKLDKNDDKKLSFDEFLARFGSVQAIADKPIYEREKSEQRRLAFLEKNFRNKMDGNSNGTVDFNEFMTRYYKPLRDPAAVAAEKAEEAARRAAEQAKRDQSAVQREIAKRERERQAAIKAAEKSKDARDKTLDRPKADRSRDE